MFIVYSINNNFIGLSSNKVYSCKKFASSIPNKYCHINIWKNIFVILLRNAILDTAVCQQCTGFSKLIGCRHRFPPLTPFNPIPALFCNQFNLINQIKIHTQYNFFCNWISHLEWISIFWTSNDNITPVFFLIRIV